MATESPDFNIKHLKIESKGIHVIGANMGEIYSQFDSWEEIGECVENMLKTFTEYLDQVNHTTFPKRGVVYYIPELEEYFKW